MIFQAVMIVAALYGGWSAGRNFMRWLLDRPEARHGQHR